MSVANEILSDITVHMKYARYLHEENRRENWTELVTRNMQMHIKKFPTLEKEIREAYQFVFDKKILPSMRSMQFAGKPIEISPNRIFNCAYAPIDDLRVFGEIMFLLLGGSERYKQQAQTLGIKNIEFLPTTADLLDVHKFLNTLSVYAHGRADGEQCSCAIIEAMSHGIPMISHVAPSMGQAEQIDNAGAIASNSDEYADVMKRLMRDSKYYETCCTNSIKRYNSVYSLNSVMTKYIELFEEIANV